LDRETQGQWLGEPLSLHDNRFAAQFNGEAELQEVAEGDKPTT